MPELQPGGKRFKTGDARPLGFDYAAIMAQDLTPYIPRLIAEWERDAPDATARLIDGTLVFVDVSGFTALSERLARKGKVGAEEVTDVMNASFMRLLASAYEEGGYLLKFGGDAPLLFFSGHSHARRGCRAACWLPTEGRTAQLLLRSKLSEI